MRAGFQAVVRNVTASRPDARIQGALIQEMVVGGVEVLLGTKDEAGIGPVLVFGLGGIYAELFDDVSVRPARFLTAEMVREMIRETRAHALLSGARGQRPFDVEAIVDVAMKLARLALSERRSIEQIDVNPLVVFERGRGVKAVDALVRLQRTAPTASRAGA